jgi:putative nucleotidyltransferase with HDIG domain
LPDWSSSSDADGVRMDGVVDASDRKREDRARQLENLPWAHLRLPPFPQIATRVLQLVNRENIQLYQLSEVISSDPAFASEVLTVANSLLYSPRYPANNILQAISILGANALQGMCITVGVRAYMGKTMSLQEMKNFWRHNLACAIIAEHLAVLSRMDKDNAYTAGILHDIGRSALAVIQPKEYARLLHTHRGPAHSILEGERALFGWDHCEVGLQLIANWKLPRELEIVVAHHHDVLPEPREWNLCALIRMSCQMADATGFLAFAGCEVVPYEQLLAQLPEEERARFFPTADLLSREVNRAIDALEAI